MGTEERAWEFGNGDHRLSLTPIKRVKLETSRGGELEIGRRKQRSVVELLVLLRGTIRICMEPLVLTHGLKCILYLPNFVSVTGQPKFPRRPARIGYILGGSEKTMLA